jgi:hypothetical protein
MCASEVANEIGLGVMKERMVMWRGQRLASLAF